MWLQVKEADSSQRRKISHHRVVYFYFIIIAIAVKNIIISFHVTYQSKFCIFFYTELGNMSCHKTAL